MRRDVFQAIADPTRREIIHLISHRSLNLNAIAGNFEVSRPAISQHIKILTECGLVVIRKEGRERYCEARLQPLHEISDWVSRYKAYWEERYDTLDGVLEVMKQDLTNAKKSGKTKGKANAPTGSKERAVEKKRTKGKVEASGKRGTGNKSR